MLRQHRLKKETRGQEVKLRELDAQIQRPQAIPDRHKLFQARTRIRDHIINMEAKLC